MDEWQKHVHDKVSAFVDTDFVYTENEVTLSMNQREAYVVLKALEAQDKSENPLLVARDSLKDSVENKK